MCPPLSRRGALQFGGMICSLGLAGCIDLSRSEEQTSRINKIEFHNYTPNEQSVLVIVEDDGEQVYDGFTAVPPAVDGSPTVEKVEDLPVESGVYDIYFNLARRPEDIEGEFWARADDTDAECREYRLNIELDDNGEPLFGVYQSSC